ncbi:MAG: iron dicitrate transport regulator FecR, partial [Cyanobacteria bacterium J06638_6]
MPLTRADVETLHNRVEFIPRGRTPRAARVSDFLAVGDALRTARLSQADLRFNDGSLARVGERATFRFVPNTRNFRLTNGTVLLLIPPGRGRTNIQ